MPTPPATVEVQARDLTPNGEIYCPHPKAGMKLWNAHPRVFFQFVGGQAQCPYCSTVYRLAGNDEAAAERRVVNPIERPAMRARAEVVPGAPTAGGR